LAVTVRSRTFSISDTDYHRVDICAAAMHMSVSEYVRRALSAVIVADCASNPGLAAYLEHIDREASASVARNAEHSERVSVPA
jgi:hypothetical protein